jgi:hypothetical protein
VGAPTDPGPGRGGREAPGLPPPGVEGLRSRFLRRLAGTGGRRTGGIFAIALAFFPPALALVAAAVGYELAGSLWGAAAGLPAGALAGLLFVRDFLRWRASLAGALALGGLSIAFAWACW